MGDPQKFPSQLAERFQLRLPDGMRDQIRDAAEASGRSMNAEIIARLQMTFEGNSQAGGEEQDMRRIAEEASINAMRQVIRAFDLLPHSERGNVESLVMKAAELLDENDGRRD